MPANDRRPARALAVSAIALALLASGLQPARAAEIAPAQAEQPVDAAPGATSELAPSPVTITFTQGTRETRVATSARTVGDFLSEAGLHIATDDYVSEDLATPLFEGMQLTYRAAVPVVVFVGKEKVGLRTAAASLDETLANARIALGPHDAVSPSLHSLPRAHEVVRIMRVDQWIAHVRHGIAAPIVRRFDSKLARGTSRTLVHGRPGERDVVVRFTRRGNERPVQTVLSSRIVRAPRATIVARGTAAPQAIATAVNDRTIAGLASRGISTALRLAGGALHMIATAYTASCYRCSGITASGVRAGFGIIAVDPHIIPLGTRLFVPGYGRAVAGDTGGAIIGHRVDLGFDSVAAAIRFGRRPVTVYVLK